MKERYQLSLQFKNLHLHVVSGGKNVLRLHTIASQSWCVTATHFCCEEGRTSINKMLKERDFQPKSFIFLLVSINILFLSLHKARHKGIHTFIRQVREGKMSTNGHLIVFNDQQKQNKATHHKRQSLEAPPTTGRSTNQQRSRTRDGQRSGQTGPGERRESS